MSADTRCPLCNAPGADTACTACDITIERHPTGRAVTAHHGDRVVYQHRPNAARELAFDGPAKPHLRTRLGHQEDQP